MCIRVLQRNRTNQIYIICYKELSHIILEAKKSHDLPSVIWRTKKAGGVIQLTGLRTRELMVYILMWVQNPKNQEHQYLRQKTGAPTQPKITNLPFFCLLVLFRPLVDYMRPTLLSLPTQILNYSGNITQTHPEINVLLAIWAFLSLGKWTQKINYHTSLESSQVKY